MSNVDILKIRKKINRLCCRRLFCDIFLPNVDILHLTTFEVNGKRGLREKNFLGDRSPVPPGLCYRKGSREKGEGCRVASVSRTERRQTA